MNFKRTIRTLGAVITLSTALALSSSFEVNAQQFETSWTPLAPEGFNESLAARLAEARSHIVTDYEDISAFSSIVVWVNPIADQYFRSRFPATWGSEMTRAITEAGRLFRSRFSLTLANATPGAWTSPNTRNGSDLLNHAWQRYGRGGQQLMVAFTGRTNLFWNAANPNFFIGGLGFVGAPGSLVMHQGFFSDAAVTRHEIGHNYGLPDRPSNVRCFMNNPYIFFEEMCASCDAIFRQNLRLF